MIYLFTGNRREFDTLCLQHDLPGSLRPSSPLQMLTSVRTLYGVNRGLVLCAGTYYNHPDCADVKEFCHQQRIPCVVVPEV
jgi:hypothetical protein